MQQLEIASNYIIDCVKKIQEDGVKSMVVRQECVDQLYEHIGTVVPISSYLPRKASRN
jgi:hypothetical protein